MFYSHARISYVQVPLNEYEFSGKKLSNVQSQVGSKSIVMWPHVTPLYSHVTPCDLMWHHCIVMWPHVTPLYSHVTSCDTNVKSCDTNVKSCDTNASFPGLPWLQISIPCSIKYKTLPRYMGRGERNGGGDRMVLRPFWIVCPSIVVLLFQTRNVCMKCVTLVRDFSPPSSHLIGQSGQREGRSHHSYEEISHLNSLFVCVYIL